MSGQLQQTEPLSTCLRAAASRAAESVGGGCVLLYAALPGDGDANGSTKLRAAAGFASPDAARSAAESLLPRVRETIAQGTVHDGPGESFLGPRGQASIWIWPIRWSDRTLGALAIGAPDKPSAETTKQLAELAAAVALRLDHDHLAAQVAAGSEETEPCVEGQSDEVLRLSEALFAQDIELLRNNEKLGKIEKLKSDFIEKMSRELRTPLNSIIEATISVLAGENDRLSDPAKASLRAALDEGAAFQRTLQNILDLWRIKQGELPVELSEVNFQEVVDEAIFSVQDTLGDKPVEIVKHFAEPFPKIRADVAKTNQILFLLLENAVKFTPSGEIRIHAEVSNGELSCRVEDTGIGICPDDQQFIFDEFFQVDEHSSTVYRGAGLGLALVRDLLVLLEGEITLSSEAGRGTTVGFRFPVQAL